MRGRRDSNRAGHRAGALLLGALQLGALATVPVADAMLELASVGLPVHVESERGASCGEGHEHVFCQLCRTLGLGALPRPDVRVSHGPSFTQYRDASAAGPAIVRTFHLAGPIGSRAPPLA
jgi:hypothetical protein